MPEESKVALVDYITKYPIAFLKLSDQHPDVKIWDRLFKISDQGNINPLLTTFLAKHDVRLAFIKQSIQKSKRNSELVGGRLQVKVTFKGESIYHYHVDIKKDDKDAHNDAALLMSSAIEVCFKILNDNYKVISGPTCPCDDKENLDLMGKTTTCERCKTDFLVSENSMYLIW
jgi:hypothetical protein